MALQLQRGHTSGFGKVIASSFAVLALLVQPFITLNVPAAFADSNTVDISTVAELRDAIEHQADGQTWTIEPGNYGLSAFNDITAQGETGWYFPITANNLTINGVGNPTIYGTGYSANGNWATQDLIAVFGNDVAINGLTLMPKVEPNKTIEVLGSNFTLTNSTITANTLTDQAEYDSISDPQDRADEKNWAGSIYFNNATGTETLTNVTLNNGGISVHAPAATLNVNNVSLTYSTDVDWINDYRFYVASPAAVINGQPTYIYHVNSTLDNFDSALAGIADPATVGSGTISLDSDLSLAKQVTVTKPVTINGNGHTLSPTFIKTDNDNNSALGIQSDNVTVNNLTVDGVDGTNLHGINVNQSNGVVLNDVTVKNNDYSGLNVNGSKVTVTNLTTANNGWNGVDVDKAGAVLTVNGTSHHNDTTAIYIDDKSVGQVIDAGHQYGSKDGVLRSSDRIYDLKPGVPTLLSPLDKGYTTTNDFYFDWSDVSGAVKYQFQNSLTNSTSSDGSLSSINYSATTTDSHLHSTGAADGSVRYWQVRAIDANGIAGDWSSVYKMTIDMTAPGIPTLKTPENHALINTNTFWFEWTAVSGADHYEFQSSQSGATDTHGSLTQNVWHGDASGDEPTEPKAWSAGASGTWYWQVRAVDAAGNKSAWTAPWDVTIDADAPVAVITAPGDGSGVNGIVNVTGTVTDAHPMNSYFSIYNSSNQLVTSSLYSDGRTNHSFVWDTTDLPEGQYTIYFEARDKLGNKQGSTTSLGTSVRKVTVTVDHTNPVVNLSDIATVTEGQGSVISGTVTDLTATHVDIYVDGVYTGTTGTTDGSFSYTQNLAKGQYQINVIAKDAASNTTTSEAKQAVVEAAPVDEGSGGDEGDSGTGSNPTDDGVGNTDSGTNPAPGDDTDTNDGILPADRAANSQQQLFTRPIVFNDGQAVLGTETTAADDTTSTSDTQSDQAVKGASDVKSDTKDKSGLNLLGFAWYWWLIVLAVIALLWWLIAASRRRKED